MHKEGIDLKTRRSGPRTERLARKTEDKSWRTATKSSSTTRTPATSGTLDKSDPSVGTGLVGAPACGDVMRLQIKVNDEGVIEDAKFKTFGCGSAIASSSLATEWIKGKTVDEADAIKNSQIVEELNLPPVKIHCSVLAEDAIKSAIADYRKKQAERAATARDDAMMSTENSTQTEGMTPAAPHPGEADRQGHHHGLPARPSRPSRRQMKKRGTPDASLRLGIRGAAARGSRTSSSSTTGRPTRATACFDSRRHRRDAGAGRRRPRRASSTSTARTLEWEQTLMQPGLQVHEPQREGGLRLRPLVHRVSLRSHASVRTVAMDPFATLGIAAQLRRRPRGAREDAPRALARAASRPLRRRGAERAAGGAGQGRRGERGVAHRARSHPSRRGAV